MQDAFVSPAELGRRCGEFKDAWYAALRRVETLADFTPEMTGELEGSMRALRGELEELVSGLEVLARSVKRAAPESAGEVNGIAEALEKRLRELLAAVEDELHQLESFRRVMGRVESLRDELKRVEGEYREVMNRVSTLCTRFFERREALRIAEEKSRERLREALEGIEREFAEKAAEIAAGREIWFAGRRVKPEEIFELLMESGRAEDIEIRAEERRGFLGIGGGEDSEAKAKQEVLRFLAQETLERARLARMREAENLKRTRLEFADLESLEEACREVEKRRREIEAYMAELREKLAEEERGVGRNFSDYDVVLELRESLRSRAEPMSEMVEALVECVERLGEGVEVESDPEKRRLRLRIKELEEQLEAEREKAASLRRRAEELESRLEELQAALEAERREAERLRAELAQLRETERELRETCRGLEDSLRSTLQTLEEAAERLRGSVNG